MRIFFYNLREGDELPYARECSERYGIDFGYCPDYPSPENYHLAEGYDTVSCTPCDMSAPVLERFHSMGVNYISTRSIGVDHIDRVRAAELGMRISNVSYPPTGVASYAVMLILMCTRRMGDILSRSKVQDFTLKDKIGEDITEMTVGIVGTGKIARAAARQLSGFGCRILYTGHHDGGEMEQHAQRVSLETLYAQSDVITLHTNATEQNYHMIDAAALAQMKDGVILVNTARGKLIDTGDLIDALESGKVGGAALDVLENENGLYYYNRMGEVIENREMAILRSFPNVILSPHTAFFTRQNIYQMVQGIFEASDAWSRGEPTVREVLPNETH